VQERGGDKHAEKDSTEKETSYDVAKKQHKSNGNTKYTHKKVQTKGDDFGQNEG